MSHVSAPTIVARVAPRRRAGVLRSFAAALLVGAMLSGAPGPAFADVAKADVEARQEKGFGRMVLTFRNRDLLPQYTLRQNNGVVVLDFTDEVDADIDQISAKLAPYVAVARRDPEHKALRIALARQVRVNVMEAGEKLFVDFLPANWAGAPPALPQEVIEALAKRAEAALRAAREAEMARVGTRIPPKLDLRIGRLPTFTRFSFAWNVPFDTKMTREGEKVSVTFNRAAPVDLSAVDLEPVAGLVDVFADEADGRLKLVFTVSPEADVRAFRDGDSYVLDLVRPTAPTNAGEAAVRAALGGTVPGKDRVSAPGKAQPMAAQPSPAPTPVAVAPAPAPAPAPAAASRPAGAPEAKPAPASEARAAAVEPSAEAAVRPVVTPESEVVARVRDLPTTDEVQAPVVPAEVPVHQDSPTGELPASLAPVQAAGEPARIKAETKRIGDVVRTTFPFAQKVAAAAFNREGVLWVVFDTPTEVDVKAIAPNLGTLARGVDQVRAKGWTAIRIDLDQPLLTTLSPDGTNWVLSVGEMVLEPTKPLKLRRFVRGDGNRSLKIDLVDGGAVHEITDPVVGDRLVVVTAQAPSRGLLKAQTLVDVEVIPSAHGVALVPHGDDVQVTYANGEVSIGSERGLSLSSGALEERDAPVPRMQPVLHRIPFDPATFDSKGGGSDQRMRQLLREIAEGGETPKRQARIDLAEFQIGRRFAPEALAQLRMLAEEEPAIIHDPGFEVLWGAAQVLAGRASQAREVLTRSDLAENVDAALWRTIAANDLGRSDEARESALKATSALGAYPKSVQGLFNLSAAEAAIGVGDVGYAQSRLAEIEPEVLERDLVGRLEVAQARLADMAGRPEDAVARFERAKATGDRRSQAEAEYHLVRNLLRDGKIDKEEAIDRMRSLSFGWRGDETELRTLRTLAGWLADTGRYRDAFQAMRSALQVAPDSPTTRLLQDEMGQRFLAIYLDDADKALAPIDALTLYYDFRELVPIGRRGDEVVRKLADRLVGVDLLAQAAELLSYQVDNRLKGAARAQIAADLAVIHLLDRKPEKALAVLNKTRQSQIPQSLERQRRLVEARALSDSGRANTALELLSTMTGSDSSRLRADVLWKAKRWREAGERLEALLANRWQDATPLDDQERQDVLRTAIGYALANDQLSLDRLRGKFAAKMAGSPNARTFDVVTQPIQSQGTEFRDVARQIASIDTMRQFLQEYRAQFLDPRARTVVPEPAVKPPEPPKPQAKAAEEKKVAQAETAAPAAQGEEPKPAGH